MILLPTENPTCCASAPLAPVCHRARFAVIVGVRFEWMRNKRRSPALSSRPCGPSLQRSIVCIGAPRSRGERQNERGRGRCYYPLRRAISRSFSSSMSCRSSSRIQRQRALRSGSYDGRFGLSLHSLCLRSSAHEIFRMECTDCTGRACPRAVPSVRDYALLAALWDNPLHLPRSHRFVYA